MIKLINSCIRLKELVQSPVELAKPAMAQEGIFKELIEFLSHLFVFFYFVL